MSKLTRQIKARFWGSRLGLLIVKVIIAATQYAVFSGRTLSLMRMDSARLRARLYKHREKSVTSSTKLHLGCGKRLVPGWLNVDVAGDGVLVDLATVPLPWQDGVFNVIVSQHVIEHLEFMEEVIPLLRELRRTAKAGAEIWLSCPDLEKTCRSYLENHGADMLEDFITRFPDLKAWRAIPAHMINSLFHQQGEHKNLYDYAMLKWACDQTGWANCTHVVEADLLKRFPDFPARNDDFHSIYITATAGS